MPGYQELRQQLLPLAQEFAVSVLGLCKRVSATCAMYNHSPALLSPHPDKQDLPAEVKAAHEHAASQYNVGWSHGKEALRSGLKDTHKGSFYANPLQVRMGGCWGGGGTVTELPLS